MPLRPKRKKKRKKAAKLDLHSSQVTQRENILIVRVQTLQAIQHWFVVCKWCLSIHKNSETFFVFHKQAHRYVCTGDPTVMWITYYLCAAKLLSIRKWRRTRKWRRIRRNEDYCLSWTNFVFRSFVSRHTATKRVLFITDESIGIFHLFHTIQYSTALEFRSERIFLHRSISKNWTAKRISCVLSLRVNCYCN